jgi:hypothetical protein
MRRLLASLLLLLPGLAAAQAPITGTVRDSVTHLPVAFASVFLANTTLGVMANEHGFFALERVPAGSYTLVASYVGYRLAKRSLVVTAAPQTVTLQLPPGANQLGEVVVRGRKVKPQASLADYQRFVELFLGRTTFSQQCSIRNRDGVVVNYAADKRELTATADNFLQVDNLALGYRIKYYGLHFTCSFGNNVFTFYGQPAFEEMTPRNERQQQHWEANRASAYHGSLAHFLKSVYDNQVREQGFLAQQVTVTPNPRFARADSLRLTLLHRLGYSPPKTGELDSLKKWTDVPAFFTMLNTHERPIDSLRRVEMGGGSVFLRFSQQLQVCYFGQGPDPRYPLPMSPIGPPGTFELPKHQVSRLRLLVPAAEIQPTGYLLNPLAVFIDEYWGFERIGEFLPVNYQPPASPSHP